MAIYLGGAIASRTRNPGPTLGLSWCDLLAPPLIIRWKREKLNGIARPRGTDSTGRSPQRSKPIFKPAPHRQKAFWGKVFLGFGKPSDKRRSHLGAIRGSSARQFADVIRDLLTEDIVREPLDSGAVCLQRLGADTPRLFLSQNTISAYLSVSGNV